MKKSELRHLIREELLKENVVDSIVDNVDEEIRVNGLHISDFEIAKDEDGFDEGKYRQLDKRWELFEKHLYGYLKLAQKFEKELK